MPYYYYDAQHDINRYVPDGWCGPGIAIEKGLLGQGSPF